MGRVHPKPLLKVTVDVLKYSVSFSKSFSISWVDSDGCVLATPLVTLIKVFVNKRGTRYREACVFLKTAVSFLSKTFLKKASPSVANASGLSAKGRQMLAARASSAEGAPNVSITMAPVY